MSNNKDVGEPLCMQCKHYHADNMDGLTCDAFPKGIPDEILDSEFIHTKPYRGDKGIQFEPVKE